MEHDEMRTCEFCGGNLYVDWWDPDTVKCDTCGWTSEYPEPHDEHDQDEPHGEAHRE